MNKVSFEEIGAVVATFQAQEGVAAGQVVKVTGDGQVGPCEAGEKFCGVALSNEGGCSGVQVRGFVRVPVTGEVALGQAGLLADGAGGVKAAQDGMETLVVQVDEAGKTAVVCL